MAGHPSFTGSGQGVARVVVFGGTHGNERTGVHIAQAIRKAPEQYANESVRSVEAWIANPRAAARNARYIDRDLNRCFYYDYTRPLTLDQVQRRIAGTREYELGRALALRGELGALAEPLPFLLDLHTTTANMGTCLMITEGDPWVLELCERLAPRLPRARIVADGQGAGFEGTTGSLARHHLTLEVGPVGQGVQDAGAIELCLQAVREALAIVDELNRGVPAPTAAVKQERYLWLEDAFDYPRDEEGLPSARLHPDFLGKDFAPLAFGEKIFLGFDGSEVRLGHELEISPEFKQRLASGAHVCPMFMGEAAYVEKGLAFLTAERVA